uniref:Ac115p n=1 Tax=Chlamydomonas reinhardtii TaxID=3055 RepID=O82765_CHLRE|nr:Ac115p [Chlamydomonas reinhardtii]AAC25088.1 Ac115p [Chlamydomonas reinhardtii]
MKQKQVCWTRRMECFHGKARRGAVPVLNPKLDWQEFMELTGPVGVGPGAPSPQSEVLSIGCKPARGALKRGRLLGGDAAMVRIGAGMSAWRATLGPGLSCACVCACAFPVMCV